MKTLLTGAFLPLALFALSPVTVRAEQWTGPKEVAQAAHGFAGAAQRLQKAIHDVSDDSPLSAEMQRVSKAASQLHDAVDKGASYEVALKSFRAIERDYAHFEGGLKKAHDVHHDKQVVAEVNKTKAAFELLQARMAGRREVGGEQKSPQR